VKGEVLVTYEDRSNKTKTISIPFSFVADDTAIPADINPFPGGEAVNGSDAQTAGGFFSTPTGRAAGVGGLIALIAAAAALRRHRKKKKLEALDEDL
jgi:hypothetical protein